MQTLMAGAISRQCRKTDEEEANEEEKEKREVTTAEVMSGKTITRQIGAELAF